MAPASHNLNLYICVCVCAAAKYYIEQISLPLFNSRAPSEYIFIGVHKTTAPAAGGFWRWKSERVARVVSEGLIIGFIFGGAAAKSKVER